MTDCTGFLQPLDLECLLVNTLAGGMDIFIALAVFGIAILAGTFRMLNIAVVIMFGLFAIVMSRFIGGFYLLAILLFGLVISYWISKMVKT